MKTNNKKDAWLPLNHKTVVCYFISYKSTDEELFGVSDYAHFLNSDPFDSILNVTVS